MGVGDHQRGAVQAAGLERAQERGPERPVLAVTDGEAQHFPSPVSGHAGGDHDGLGGHPGALAALAATDAGLAVRRVQEHVGELLLGQVPVGERRDLGVEVRADPGDLGLGDPGVRTQRLDQVIDLPHARAGHVGLHHHREQGLVDPAPPLEQAREERPRPQLGDRQLQIPRRGGQHPGPVPVALHHPGLGALVQAGTDRLGGLGLDQLLVHPLQRQPDTLHAISGVQSSEQFEQGRLGQGHRVCLLREFLGGFSRSLTRWPLNAQEADPELHHVSACTHRTRGVPVPEANAPIDELSLRDVGSSGSRLVSMVAFQAPRGEHEHPDNRSRAQVLAKARRVTGRQDI